MELHLQVKAARKQAGLTQEEVAARADVNRTDISRFEHGENVTMKTFLRIIGAIPDLKELNLNGVRLNTNASPVPDQADVLQTMARAFLQNLAGEGETPPQAPPPQTAPPANGETPREQSMLRAFGQFLVELAGGGKR